MATAMKCDRCGNFYGYSKGSNSEKSNGVIHIDRDLNNIFPMRKSYDLCPDCMKKLEAFIKNDDNNIVYKE